MKLKDFIKSLKQLEKKHGGDKIVTMADMIEVVKPIYIKYGDGVIVITDENEENEDEEEEEN